MIKEFVQILLDINTLKYLPFYNNSTGSSVAEPMTIDDGSF